MKKIAFLLSVSLLLSVFVNAQVLHSPDGKFTATFALQTGGTPTYMLSFKDKAVIKSSKLGLELKNDKQSLLDHSPSLLDDKCFCRGNFRLPVTS